MEDTYRSSTQGFEIRKPSQWEFEESDEGNLTLSMMPPGRKKDGKTQVHFVIVAASASGMAADQFPPIRERLWKSMLKDTYKKTAEGDIALSGEAGKSLSFISDKGQESMKWEEHYVVRNDILYLLQSMCPLTLFDDFSRDFGFILGSLKLIELSQEKHASSGPMGAVESEKGTVIFLNGASSSGKTTIAKKLQGMMTGIYLLVSIDAFMQQLPAGLDSKRLEEVLPGLLAGFNASAAAMARAGNNVIVDHVLWQRPWVLPCVEAFKGVDVVFVGVRCPLEVLEAREDARGDRFAGIARLQHESAHHNKVYDLEVDTSKKSADECARAICEYIELGRKPEAFIKLGAIETGTET